MIINNENNRTNIEASIPEALELIAELSKAITFALEHGHRTTSGMAATTLKRSDAREYKPSSFNMTVSK